MSLTEANLALTRFIAMPLERYPHIELIPEIWRLRNSLSAYDASYLALARFPGAELVTLDEGLRKIAARGRIH